MKEIKQRMVWVMVSPFEMHKVYEVERHEDYTEVEDWTPPFPYTPFHYNVENYRILDDSQVAEILAQKLEKEKEAWEAEKEAKPIEFINNAVKRLCNGLQIGQKVWLVKSYAERVVCPKCNGTGRVNVQYYNGDVVEQQCECCGKTVFKYRYRVCEDYVDSVRIAIKFTQQCVYIGTDRDFYQSDQVVYLKENGEAKVKSIFSSPEDAQKEADLRNIRED